MAKANSISSLSNAERLLDLVPFLVTHQGIALDELAREFSISTAQLTEDLTTLWLCGLPGYTPLELMDLSFDTGYVTISNAETLSKPRILNRDEVLSLILGLETLLAEVETSHADLGASISALVLKLIAFLDSSISMRVKAGTSVSSVERGVIEKSISHRSAVKISYHSLARDEVSDRIIFPLEFTFNADREYISAYCLTSRGYRSFRMDRILTAFSDSDEETTPPSAEDPDGKREKFPITITMSSRFRDIAERFNLDSRTINSTGMGNTRIESFSQDWAIREIMSFGGAIEVKAPLSLRLALLERSENALKAYRGAQQEE